MRIIRSFIAPAAALAVASGIARCSRRWRRPTGQRGGFVDRHQPILGSTDRQHRAAPSASRPLGNGTGNDNCQLGLGNAVAVARLQIALDECNLHAGLAVDSDYGPLTRQAVISVERAEHVTQMASSGQ